MTNGNQVETKEGTQSTPVKIRVSLSLTMPIWVTNVVSPIGKWTTVLMTKVMVVRWGIEWIIWSVARVQDPIFRCKSLSINNTGWKNGMFGIYARRSRREDDITCKIVNDMGRSSITRLKLSTRIHHSRLISRRSLRCRIGSISDWLRLQKVQKLVTLSLCNRTLRRMKPYHSPLEPEEQWWIIHDNYVFHLTMYS